MVGKIRSTGSGFTGGNLTISCSQKCLSTLLRSSWSTNTNVLGMERSTGGIHSKNGNCSCDWWFEMMRRAACTLRSFNSIIIWTHNFTVSMPSLNKCYETLNLLVERLELFNPPQDSSCTLHLLSFVCCRYALFFDQNHCNKLQQKEAILGRINA